MLPIKQALAPTPPTDGDPLLALSRNDPRDFNPQPRRGLAIPVAGARPRL